MTTVEVIPDAAIGEKDTVILLQVDGDDPIGHGVTLSPEGLNLFFDFRLEVADCATSAALRAGIDSRLLDEVLKGPLRLHPIRRRACLAIRRLLSLGILNEDLVPCVGNLGRVW